MVKQEYGIKEFDDLMHEVEKMKDQIRNLIDNVVEKEKNIPDWIEENHNKRKETIASMEDELEEQILTNQTLMAEIANLEEEARYTKIGALIIIAFVMILFAISAYGNGQLVDIITNL